MDKSDRCQDCLGKHSAQLAILPLWENGLYPQPALSIINDNGTLFRKLITSKETSDGSSAGYYTLPKGAKELQDLISHKDMNAQMGEIFRAVYRFGEVSHSPKIRDIKKIIFYANEELKRLEKLGC